MSSANQAVVNPSQGAVKVKVKLTNPLDEYFVEQGQLDPSQVHTCEIDALVDRRKVRTFMPVEVMRLLDLRVQWQEVLKFADGSEKVVSHTESVKIELLGRETSVDTIVAGDEVVIGQVVLELLDLVVDEENQRVIPNPAHPNGPVFRI
ncbi:hypothetical protein [Kamptonema formosum]|uniref:hypothetical protein n=1 Tax=Kamptonema formosum TaxID=331992 RepID=UPI00037E480F|nr:hypothetical protein [Oscillatoria sp. PCC 10802]